MLTQAAMANGTRTASRALLRRSTTIRPNRVVPKPQARIGSAARRRCAAISHDPAAEGKCPLEPNTVTRLALQTSNKRDARPGYPVEGRAQCHRGVIRSTSFRGMVTVAVIAREWRPLNRGEPRGTETRSSSPPYRGIKSFGLRWFKSQTCSHRNRLAYSSRLTSSDRPPPTPTLGRNPRNLRLPWEFMWE